MVKQALNTAILVILTYQAAWAQDPRTGLKAKYSTENIEFIDTQSPYYKNKGSYPALFSSLFDNYLSWVPTGEKKPLSEKCDFKNWQSALYQQKQSTEYNELGSYLQKYVDECGPSLETGENGLLENVHYMLSMKFNPQEHPFFHKVMFHLPGNIKLKGILGLKGDQKPRPLIIVRLGIFASIEDFYADRAWAMMLFEQSPFNVLLVENMTNTDFVENNTRFSFGGYDEGIQNIYLAKYFKNPQEPLSELVSSVHYMGISLGGHGVLFSSLLNGLNSSPKKSLINSFLLMCPVVDLKKSMSGLTNKEYYAPLIDVWSRRRLSGIFLKDPQFKTNSYFSFLPTLIGKIEKDYRGGLSYNSSIKLPEGMKDSSDFWGVNDYWKYYEKIKEPVLIFATELDPAVNFNDNSKTILEKKIGQNTRNLNVVEMKRGYHCTLPVAYDWASQVTLYQNYFLSQASEFSLIKKNSQLDNFDEKEIGNLVDYRIQISEISPTATAIQGFVVKTKKGTEKKWPFSVPLGELDFKFPNKTLSDSEREMLVRWAHQNLEISSLNSNKMLIQWEVAK